MADRTITPTAREAEPDVHPDEAPEAAVQKPASSGNFKVWLPLLATVVAMPALAYATTQFLLLPKIKHSMAQYASATPAATPAESGKDGHAGVKPGKLKVMVPLPKILVNVAGTMMTRYLMTSMTLVGNTADFKEKIEANRDQLIDVANGSLGTKTIADLEKPGARNVIRSELLTAFNNALGGPLVQDIYITEQAIQ